MAKKFAVLLLPLCAMLQSIAVVFGKMAGISLKDNSILTLVANPLYLASLFFLGLQYLVWMASLRVFPLKFAYPFLSLSFVFNFLFSRMVFKEAITFFNASGILIVAAGVFLVSLEKE